MLFGLKLLFLKSKAAVSIQNELEYAKSLMHAPFINPAQDANKIIEVFCEKHSDILVAAYSRSGLPNKLSLAAIASAFTYEALSNDENNSDESFQNVMQLVLARLLIQISSQDPSISFKEVDRILLEKSHAISLKFSTNEQTSPVIPTDLREY
jgi:hypothetical protein